MSLHSLMFGWEFPPHHSGGLGVACEGLVRGLLRNGVRVTLVLPREGAAEQDGLTVRTLEGRTLPVIEVESVLQPYEGTEEFALRMGAINAGERLPELYGPDLAMAVERFAAVSVELTKDVEPDVVHCHDWMTYGAGIRAAKYHKAPLVAHIHATELDRTHGNPNQWIFDRERQGLLAADGIVAVSAYTKNILVKEYGIDGHKVTVVHNAHDKPPQAVAPALVSRSGKRPPLVLFVGRLTLQKNPEQFLEVAALVRKHRPDVRFVMAGDGPMLGRLLDQACRLGLADSMVFAGKVAKREAEALYAAADCFVMPSLSEPFGLVALEAVAHGVPVILSKQSGVAEVLDHAFKVDFWDTDKMADCILTVLREQPLARQLRAEAPRVLRRLSWINQASAIRDLYHRIRS